MQDSSSGASRLPSAAALASEEPTPTPSASVALAPSRPATPVPSRAADISWSALERTIRAGVREDVAGSCVPRRHDLPTGTAAALECTLSVTPVGRVAFYVFDSADEAFGAYVARIAAEGITRNMGDASRPSGAFEGGLYICAHPVKCRFREARFVNRSGFANYRAVMDVMYIGVLGTNDDVNDLRRWAWISNGPTSGPGEVDPVPETPTLYFGGLVDWDGAG
jgi:hypothetical protein